MQYAKRMFGKNPKRAPIKGDGLILDVQEIFPTFQGEGIYAGMPSVFVRLGGCNLACHFCDTEFENFEEIALDRILEKIDSYSGIHKKLVVITGGEPLRQPLTPLCDALLEKGYKVQIETNGTLFQPLDKRVDIVCSPKAGSHGYAPLRPDMLNVVSALKFIISASDPLYNHVPDIGQGRDMLVFIQPMDEYDDQKNAANLSHCLKLAQQQNVRLSVQLHKIIGVE